MQTDNKISSTATSDRETRRAKLVTEFSSRSGTMKEPQLVAESENMLDEQIATIAKLELERRKQL